MTKTFKQIPKGDRVVYVTTLRDIPATEGWARNFRQFEFLREIADSVYNGLLDCGPLRFETMDISYDGEAWVAVLKAEEVKL